MKHSILAAMLILMASNAMAFGSPGSVVVDIVGSDVKDTVVVADGRGGIDLEIIGSTAKNTTVSPYMSLAICQSCQICPACPTCPMPIYPTPVCPTCPTCPRMRGRTSRQLPGIICIWESTPGMELSGIGTTPICPNGRRFSPDFEEELPRKQSSSIKINGGPRP